MYNAIDSTGEGKGIRRNSSVFSSVYFILYMIVVTFILLNLFVGFVIVTFQRVGVKPFKEANLDRNQVRNSAKRYNTLLSVSFFSVTVSILLLLLVQRKLISLVLNFTRSYTI